MREKQDSGCISLKKSPYHTPKSSNGDTPFGKRANTIVGPSPRDSQSMNYSFEQDNKILK